MTEQNPGIRLSNFLSELDRLENWSIYVISANFWENWNVRYLFALTYVY